MQKSELLSSGRIFLPSDYDEPYPITLKLIEDGRNHLIFKKPLMVQCPIRMLQEQTIILWKLKLLRNYSIT